MTSWPQMVRRVRRWFLAAFICVALVHIALGDPTATRNEAAYRVAVLVALESIACAVEREGAG